LTTTCYPPLKVTHTKEAAEKESSDLKEEIKRLQEQHSDLYKKIEGDEGAKAALESLRKENETLKKNLEDAAKTHADKLLQESTNLYNVTKSLEKVQLEIEKVNKSHEEDMQLKIANEQRLMEDLNKQVSEVNLEYSNSNKVVSLSLLDSQCIHF